MTLPNAKHERFAQAIAKGVDATKAYGQVYPKAKKGSANRAGARLLAIVRVRDRVAELQGKAEDETLLSIAEKRRFCADVLRTPIGEIDETSPLCHSVKRTTGEHGNTVEYKAVDKLKALQLDNELAGHVILAERQAVSVNVGVAVAVNVMTEERRAELMAKKQAAIARRLAGKK